MPQVKTGDLFVTNYGDLLVQQADKRRATIRINNRILHFDRVNAPVKLLGGGGKIKYVVNPHRGRLRLEFEAGVRGIRREELLKPENVKTFAERMLWFLQDCYLKHNIRQASICNQVAYQFDNRLFKNLASQYEENKRWAGKIVIKLRDNNFEGAMESAKAWVEQEKQTPGANGDAPAAPGTP